MWYQAQPRALRALLVINVVLYVLWILVLGRIGATAQFFYEHLALHPVLPALLFEPWQLVTYNFLHLGAGLGGFFHVLFNMLWLYWIGRDYEEMHGAHYLLAVYLLAGVGGGLLSLLATPLLGSATIYGASASVLGIITVVAVRYPYKKIRLFLLGTWRLLHLVIAFLVLDVLLMLLAMSNAAVAAHLGGALVGFLMVRGEDRGFDLTSWARVFFRSRSRGGSRSRPSGGSSSGGFSGRMRDLFEQGEEKTPDRPSERERRSRGVTLREDRIRRNAGRSAREEEVARILDKITERVYEALSDEEKRTLQEASRQ